MDKKVHPRTVKVLTINYFFFNVPLTLFENAEKNPSTVASVYDQFKVTHKDYSEVMNKETFSKLGNMEERGSQKMDHRVRVFLAIGGWGPVRN